MTGKPLNKPCIHSLRCKQIIPIDKAKIYVPRLRVAITPSFHAFPHRGALPEVAKEAKRQHSLHYGNTVSHCGIYLSLGQPPGRTGSETRARSNPLHSQHPFGLQVRFLYSLHKKPIVTLLQRATF